MRSFEYLNLFSKIASYKALEALTPIQKRIMAIAKKYYPQKGSHGWNDHIFDVFNTAKKLKGNTLSDKEFAAIVLHDIERRNFDFGHSLHGSRRALRLLQRNRLFNKADRSEIRQAILEHSSKWRRANNLANSSGLSTLLDMADRGTPSSDIRTLVDRPLRFIFEGSDVKKYSKLGKPVPYDISNNNAVASRVAGQLKEWYGNPTEYSDIYGTMFNDVLRARANTVNNLKPDDILPYVLKYRNLYKG